MSENVKPCSESTSNFADSEVSEVAENGLFSARKSLEDNNFQFRRLENSKNTEKWPVFASQVVENQALPISQTPLDENDEKQACKSLPDNNFQFRSFADSPNMYESARTNAKGKAVPPERGVHAVPRLGLFGAENPEHIGSICQRVLEAWGRRVEP